jgi:MFS family permease
VSGSGSFRAVGVSLANPNLRRLQLAWAGSILGSCTLVVALAVAAFNSGGSAAVGILMLARMVAAAAASPVLSALADRHRRRLVMASSDLLRSVLTLGLGIVAEVHSSTWAIYGLAVLIAMVGTAFRPAQAALVPSLATAPEEVNAANALAGTIEAVGLFVGPAIGGALLAVSGTAAVFALCAGAFLWSATLTWRIDERSRNADLAGQAGYSRTGMTAGLRAIAFTPTLLAVTFTYAAQCMVAGALGVFAVVLAIDVLDLGNAGVGYLDAAFGGGALLGGAVAIGLTGSRRLAAFFACGVLCWGAGVAALGATNVIWIVLLLMAVVGASNTVVDVTAVTVIQRSAPDAVLARVFGALQSLLMVSVGIGSVLAPVAIHVVGLRAALVVTGLLLPAAVAVVARTLLRLDRLDPTAANRVELLRAQRIFAPLPEGTLEQLARNLDSAAVAAGTEVVAQGDPSDRVYLVVTGELTVDVDGRAAPLLRSGDIFGEIGLLRDVPRSASVRAQTACELLTLERGLFLAAVTGHPRSAAEAEVVISTRLSALRPGVVSA